MSIIFLEWIFELMLHLRIWCFPSQMLYFGGRHLFHISLPKCCIFWGRHIFHIPLPKCCIFWRVAFISHFPSQILYFWRAAFISHFPSQMLYFLESGIYWRTAYIILRVVLRRWNMVWQRIYHFCEKIGNFWGKTGFNDLLWWHY